MREQKYSSEWLNNIWPKTQMIGMLVGVSAGILMAISAAVSTFSDYSLGDAFVRTTVIAILLPFVFVANIWLFIAFWFRAGQLFHAFILTVIGSLNYEITTVIDYEKLRNTLKFEDTHVVENSKESSNPPIGWCVLILCREVILVFLCIGVFQLFMNYWDDEMNGFIHDYLYSSLFFTSLMLLVIAGYFFWLPFGNDAKGGCYWNKTKGWPIGIRSFLFFVGCIFLGLSFWIGLPFPSLWYNKLQ